jgi:hypothetical protein
MPSDSRPYVIVDIMRTILTHQPHLLESPEHDVRNAFADEVESHGFDGSRLPNDLRRVFFKVKEEIESGILSIVPESERRVSKPPELLTSPIIDDGNPFSRSKINHIFETLTTMDKDIATKEGYWLDFKENYNQRNRAEYARTMAGFANNVGGYLVFGVTDVPHKAVGMSNDNFDQFRSELLTQYLLSRFTPSIRWDHRPVTRNGKKFGLIHTQQCDCKPIIAIQGDSNHFQKGDIFYRYPGLTRTIEPQDLLRLIDERIQAQNERWQASLSKMASLTPRGAEILDLATGRIGDTPILIDQKLLEHIKLIREGEFHERRGDPTLRLIGEVTGPAGVVVVPKGRGAIDQLYIISCFLDQECAEPVECIKYLVNQNTAILPLWFFIVSAGMGVEDARSFIQSCHTRLSNIRARFLNRLEQGEKLNRYSTSTYLASTLNDEEWDAATFDDDVARLIDKHSLSTKVKNSVGRTLVSLSLHNNNTSILNAEFASSHIREVLEGIAVLAPEDIKRLNQPILTCLKSVLTLCTNGDYWSRFRHTVCYVDAVLYAPADMVTTDSVRSDNDNENR